MILLLTKELRWTPFYGLKMPMVMAMVLPMSLNVPAFNRKIADGQSVETVMTQMPPFN